jgi:uncharacterized membrane protein
MNRWVALSVVSLAGISFFSIYIGTHIAQGIICNYIQIIPYLLPTAYVLGFFLGYSLIQIKSERKPEDVADLFEGNEKEAVLVALRDGTQADVARKVGKVRAHRTIRALETKGIVEKIKKGNTYLLKPGKKLQKLHKAGQ